MNTSIQGKVETLQLTATMWSSFTDIDDVRPIDDEDYKILSELRAVLEKNNALDRFGVNLIHRHFDVSDDEIIVEDTYSDLREQKMVVRNLADVDRSKVIETQWVFNGQKDTVCRKTCNVNDGHRPGVHIKVGV